MEDAMHIVKSAEPAMSCVDPREAQSVPIRADIAEIVVVRHGQTDWNFEHRIQGHSNVQLNEVGRQQTNAVIKEPDLREQNTGKLQGLSVSEAANVYPQIFKDFRSRRWDLEIPGGETKDQVYQRCTTCLQNIGLKHKGERVIVVTHGTVFRSIYRRACPKDGPAPKVQNGSVSILHFSGEDKWVMKSWSDHSHLNQTEDKL
ncbi:phosphoglycerate mutase-like protein 4 isoform X3 [Rhodamnia argentea]|uniref:Phosphoglycerate mutase-like protein 4 isoform X3 n=1 Tax=Rhodamnia argentea TaxID=178133 RepID=A0ABM3GVF8_9MYRT|nr:phosphoglycerate mutase-like protein 4 isoform X3 [Rhodamnia argentea]